MLRVREWARKYCDMLDGAEEAPTVNELYKAIELDETTLFNDAVTCAVLRANRIIRDLQDEVDWLNAELHGAELEANKLRKLVGICIEYCANGYCDDGCPLTEGPFKCSLIENAEELGVEV